jgi:hypothetical protein
VQHYRPGEAFASEWGARRVERRSAGVARERARALPEASQGLDRAYATGGVPSAIRAGEASFSGSLAGTPGIGYVFAATELAKDARSALWQVRTLSGFVAPAARAGQASAWLAHLAASFEVDPRWLAEYANSTRAMSEVVAQSGQVMARAIDDRYRAE